MRREIVTVQRFGDQMGIALPGEMVERRGWKEGDTLHVVSRADGVLLTSDAEHAETMAELEAIRREYDTAFRDLADR